MPLRGVRTELLQWLDRQPAFSITLIGYIGSVCTVFACSVFALSLTQIEKKPVSNPKIGRQ
jgi:hypothetical protein